MEPGWNPPLVLNDYGDRCRLWLGRHAWGDGSTLQEAADDLVARLIAYARAFRGGGFSVAAQAGADHRWLDLLHELGELDASGGDVRARALYGDGG